MDVPANVSRETLRDLERFRDLLIKWTPKINLVSKSSILFVWERHIWDSLQITDILSWPLSWVDIGSGGGFPGLVVSIVAKQNAPACKVTLIESDHRKCAFLRTVIRDLELNAEVLSQRIEDADPSRAGVLSARALADLDDLLGHASRHLSKNGVALFLKGETWENEVEVARQSWSFRLAVHKSKTNPDAAVLEIKEIERV